MVRGAAITALASALAALVGAIGGWGWLVASGLVGTLWFLFVDMVEDEPIRGPLEFLSVPVVLTAALVTA